MKRLPPPPNQQELLRRAQGLAGLTLAELALESGFNIPDNSTRGKGWTGQVCEALLGCDAGSEDQPDFTGLGIELKTIPISPQGQCLESTFICQIPLLDINKETWLTSRVWRKCQHVLWLPIICPEKSALHDRHIGMPHLWRPNEAETATLQQDWQELTNMLCMGQIAQITAHHGQALQIRPKGANAKSVVWGIDEKGDKTRTLPRGFYLRSCFTQALLNRAFARS